MRMIAGLIGGVLVAAAVLLMALFCIARPLEDTPYYPLALVACWVIAIAAGLVSFRAA